MQREGNCLEWYYWWYYWPHSLWNFTTCKRLASTCLLTWYNCRRPSHPCVTQKMYALLYSTTPKVSGLQLTNWYMGMTLGKFGIPSWHLKRSLPDKLMVKVPTIISSGWCIQEPGTRSAQQAVLQGTLIEPKDSANSSYAANPDFFPPKSYFSPSELLMISLRML